MKIIKFLPNTIGSNTEKPKRVGKFAFRRENSWCAGKLVDEYDLTGMTHRLGEAENRRGRSLFPGTVPGDSEAGVTGGVAK